MKRKYIFVSEDVDFIEHLKSVINAKCIDFQEPPVKTAQMDRYEMVLLDGDSRPLVSLKKELKSLKRKNIPVVLFFTALDGKEVVKLLKLGAISVLFKDCSAGSIKKELKELLDNYHYYEKLKELEANEARTHKFLEVVKTLTSNSDVNQIMVTILESVKEVFNLSATAFYLVTNDVLKRKFLLGDNKQLPQEAQWEMKDVKIQWLQEVQEQKYSVYVTQSSKPYLTNTFSSNTILLPLVIKETFFGLILASFPPERSRLTGKERELLTAFAEQTSVALENARLYWDILRAREELVFQEKKSLLGEIILSLNHEINNPLSIISMEAQLLHKRIDADKQSNVEGRLANIETNIDRIKNILETISALNVEGQITTEYIPGRRMLNLQHNGH